MSYSSTFGCSLNVTSDRGSQFCSQLFQDVCRELKIKLHYATCFHLEGNSHIKRCNKTIKEALYASFQNKANTWDEQLNFVVLTLNCAYHNTIKTFPILLFLDEMLNYQFPIFSNCNIQEFLDSSGNHKMDVIVRVNE